jgi:SAM-dependent methyltransferase
VSRSWSLPPVTIRLDSPSVARVYDYCLGGTTNWAIDRIFADRILNQFPLIRRIASIDRLYLNRVVRHLLKNGVRQFLDVGCGVPNAGATHRVADEWTRRRKKSDVRVVYVDNDPIAVAHGALILDREGDRRRHAMLEADLRDPDALWQAALATNLIDPTEPVGLLLIAVLHIQQLDAAGRDIGPACVARLRELLPAGSYVAMSHLSDDKTPPAARSTLEGLRRAYAGTGNDVTWRTREEIESMLDSCHLVSPGWTTASAWRPEETGPGAPLMPVRPLAGAVVWSGVGQKM